MMETHMGDLEALVHRQERALNVMESKLCKCGGSRWAESLEDLQIMPGLVSSSLSYATPPVVPVAIPEVEVVLELPELLPVCELAGVVGEEVPVVIMNPASEWLILRVHHKQICKQAEPYPCMALGCLLEVSLQARTST